MCWAQGEAIVTRNREVQMGRQRRTCQNAPQPRQSALQPRRMKLPQHPPRPHPAPNKATFSPSRHCEWRFGQKKYRFSKTNPFSSWSMQIPKNPEYSAFAIDYCPAEIEVRFAATLVFSPAAVRISVLHIFGTEDVSTLTHTASWRSIEWRFWLQCITV